MRRALLAAVVAGLVCAPAAFAGPDGAWTEFTDADGSNIDYMGLQRTADGVLHAAWLRGKGDNTTDVVHRAVAPSGASGPPVTVANWPSVSAPDIAVNPGGGLITLWGGIKGGVESGFATSDDSGAAWTESPTAPVSGNAVYASAIGMENGADGTVFQAWYGTGGTFVHRGSDGTTPNFDYQAPLGGYAFSAPNLARDGADGTLWLGWPTFSAGTNNGAWVNQVDQATGAPLSAPIKVPGSSTTFQGQEESISTLGRWAITGRPGRPGVFVASPAGYPTSNKIIFWRVGESSSATIETSASGHRQVAIAADPDGRIIVLWGTFEDGADRLFARVSNTNVSSFGPKFEIPLPAGQTALWAIAASAQSGALIDVFANVTTAAGGERYFHTQAVPPPVLAKSVNATIISGVVLIKLAGSKTFVPLTHDSQIPIGATVDATKGRVRIVTALPGGKTQSADFFQGVFRITQATTGLTDLALVGGDLAICGKAKRAAAAKVVSIRKLWGAGKGKFRTKGKYATASIRGTTWLTQDRCDGTLVRVTVGSVTVRDLITKKNIVVKKGQSYLAKR